MRPRRLLPWLAASLLASAAGAATFPIERVAHAGSPGPGWGQPLNFSAPALDAGRVAFHAFEWTVPARFGTYLWEEGAISVVADSTTPIPGSADTFGFFRGTPALSGDTVAFVTSDSMGFLGVYTWAAGALAFFDGAEVELHRRAADARDHDGDEQ